MQKLQFSSKSGQTYYVDLPAPLKSLKSVYLFSFHKSGSTLMDNMVREYCRQMGVPTFSLFNFIFDSGISTHEVMNDTLVCFSRTGRIYTGFRHFPHFDLDLRGSPCVLLVRDPRDMLVSMYYSVSKSHVLPRKNLLLRRKRQEAAAMGIDEFVLDKAGQYLNHFHRYQKKLPTDTLSTYRYEDVIYEKEAWLKDLVETMSLPQDQDLIKKIARQFDIFPKREEQEKHIRQVHPGNYKTKLKPQTIDTINDSLEEFLRHYDYF